MANERARHIGAVGAPLGCDERRRQMTARRVATHDEALAKASMQEKRGGADVFDDVGNRYFRAKPISNYGDRVSARVGAASPMAEHRRLQRAPVTAVNDDKERKVRVVAIRMEKIDRVARVRAIGNAEFGAPRPRATIGGCIPLPATNDLGVLRNPGAVVVFDLEIERAQA